MRRVTEAEKKIIQELYPNTLTSDLAKQLDMCPSKLWRYASRIGVSKSLEFLNEKGGRFKKGVEHSEASKATRFTKGHQTDRTRKPKKERSKAGCYKKGNKPASEKYDGAIVTRTQEDSKYKSLWIRVAPKKWEPLSHNVWKKHNGEIKPGYVIRLIDGNYKNCDISNLEMITKSENAYKNVNKYPKEIKEVIRLTNKLKKKISEKQS